MAYVYLREETAQIIDKHFKIKEGKIYYYNSLDDKVKNILKNHFQVDANSDEFVAFYGFPSRNMLEGIVFFTKNIYVKYFTKNVNCIDYFSPVTVHADNSTIGFRDGTWMREKGCDIKSLKKTLDLIRHNIATMFDREKTAIMSIIKENFYLESENLYFNEVKESSFLYDVGSNLNEDFYFLGDDEEIVAFYDASNNKYYDEGLVFRINGLSYSDEAITEYCEYTSIVQMQYTEKSLCIYYTEDGEENEQMLIEFACAKPKYNLKRTLELLREYKNPKLKQIVDLPENVSKAGGLLNQQVKEIKTPSTRVILEGQEETLTVNVDSSSNLNESINASEEEKILALDCTIEPDEDRVRKRKQNRFFTATKKVTVNALKKNDSSIGVECDMSKTIKFNLICNDKPIRTIEDLQYNFSVEDILGYYNNNLLHKWLDVRGYHAELEKVNSITSEKPIEILKELIQIFGVLRDGTEIEEDLYMLEYQAEKEELYTEYKESDYKVQKIIRDYHVGYSLLVDEILNNSTDVVKIKAVIKEMVNSYEGLFKLNHRSLFYSLKDISPLALMCLLMNEKTRHYYIRKNEVDETGTVIVDKNADRVEMHRLLSNYIRDVDFRRMLGEHLLSYSGETDGYWKDLEPKGKQCMIISMEKGDFARPAGVIGGDLSHEDIYQNFVIVDGLDYKSNSAKRILMYMEV